MEYIPHVAWSPMAQWIKNLPAMPEIQEMWVWSLGHEDPLEKEMATHSSVFAWEIPWTEEPGGLQSKGSQRVKHDWASMHATMTLNKDLKNIYTRSHSYIDLKVLFTLAVELLKLPASRGWGGDTQTFRIWVYQSD